MSDRLTTIVLPFGVLVLVVVAFYWKAVFLGHLFMTNDIAGSDMMMHSFPARAELAEALREGRFTLWTDRVFLGFPIAAEGQAGVFYPLNWLFFLLLPVGRAYTLLMIFHVILAGVFVGLYAREVGRSRTSALLAALVMVLSGFMVTHLKHANLIASASWVMGGLWLVERWTGRMEEWRWGVLLGLFMALAIVAGHVQTAYIGLLALLSYFAVVMIGRGVEDRSWVPVRRTLVAGILCVALTLGLSSVQTFLSYEYSQLGTRSQGLTYEEATEFDYRVDDLVMWVDPYHFGDPGRATYFATGEVQRLFWENCGYVGILPLVLAMVGGVFCWRRPRVRFLIGLGVISLLIVLGKGSPIHGFFFQVVPGFDRFRMPARFLLLTTFSVAVLAAYGLDRLRDWAGRGRRGRTMIGVGVIAISVINLFWFGYTHNPTLPVETWLEAPESVALLRQDAETFRIWSPDAHLLHLKAYREAAGWKGDLSPYIEQRNALQANLNALYGIHSVAAYFPVVPLRFLDGWTGLSLRPPRIWRVLDLYNVKYLLTGSEIRDPHVRECAELPGGVNMYENLEVLPRARVVSSAIPVVGPEQALARIADPSFDPAVTVTLEGAADGGKGESLSGSWVREVNRRGGRVELEASMTTRGFLVLADAFYPGWEVWVDGEKGDVLCANVICRAVELSPGTHQILFRYRPRSFLYGLAVTLLSLVVVAVSIATRRHGDKVTRGLREGARARGAG